MKKVVVIHSEEDFLAAVYFLNNDKRSTDSFYKYGTNGLLVSEEQEKLLREINIPFYVRDV